MSPRTSNAHISTYLIQSIPQRNLTVAIDVVAAANWTLHSRNQHFIDFSTPEPLHRWPQDGSSIASTVSIATFILGKPSNWHDWRFLVKRKALQLAVDEVIDPDFVIEPPLPIKSVQLSPDQSRQPPP